MNKLIKYPKSKFIYTEDEFMECECRDCGWTTEEEQYLVCPECNGEDLVTYSCHEGAICEGCNCEFDIWEDCYTYVTPELNVIMICEDCYNKLEED